MEKRVVPRGCFLTQKEFEEFCQSCNSFDFFISPDKNVSDKVFSQYIDQIYDNVQDLEFIGEILNKINDMMLGIIPGPVMYKGIEITTSKGEEATFLSNKYREIFMKTLTLSDSFKLNGK